MKQYRVLWWSLLAVLAVTFTIFGFCGVEIYRQAPPIPREVRDPAGSVLWTKDDILAGQDAWRSTGGMELGSIWGHGAYQAPDWSADWLHSELIAWLDCAALETQDKPFDALSQDDKAVLLAQLQREYRTNTYNPTTGVLTLSSRRVAAIAKTARHYRALFGADPALRVMRDNYAMKDDTLPSDTDRTQLTRFFAWTAWVAATERPGTVATYTANWPPEPLIANRPTTENIMWSLACVVILVLGVGALIWGWAFLRGQEDHSPTAPLFDPLATLSLTPSQRSLGKYVFLVIALFVFQVFIGGFTAHYTTEGQSFYGLQVSRWFPYALTRTWHLQSALLWIATGFLTAGLFLAPVIHGGKDPRFQKVGVDLLFWALVLVAGGSFTGNYLAIAHILPEAMTFWLGHQGYEFLDLGRVWQLALFAGLLFWLVLMLRGMLPAMKRAGDNNLLLLLVVSTIAIGLFYGTGLLYGPHTHITVMEYWRWWVVHLWVEGIFEVFATAALAFIFVSLGLASKPVATAASLASASLFMLGGVPGTFHHLYFSGTTTPVLAIGAAFSALEVVPLVILGYEAWERWSLKGRAPWMEELRWPLACFVAVAFWNMLGAGVFGFMINTPLALYYLQGLNTTAVHAHAALFGVYGFLALGFTFLVLRYIRPDLAFSDGLMKTGFWSLNLGLALMILTSLLPVGIFQFAASISVGMWWARSDTFLQQGFLEFFRWFRMVGDVVFIVGVVAVAWQVVVRGLWRSRI
jgi:nitric oxide reductase subunit B